AYFDSSQLSKSINPTDQELRAYYESHKAQYANTIPEKRKLRYAVIDAAKAGDTTVTPQDVQSYYNSHIQQFQVPERVKAAHILITPKPGKDGKPDDAAAKAKAEDLLKQAKGGADFAKLASANSDDPGSKDKGGELGFFGKGQMVPEFEKAAFSLSPGQVSDLVHTPYGYHIIKLEQKEAAHPQSLDEVKGQIEGTLQAQKRSQVLNKYVDQVQSDVKAEGFDKAAAKFGLKVQMTDFVSQTEPLPGLGPSPELTQAAFSSAKNSPVVARTGQNYAIVEATDIQPAATPTFEQAKTQVEAQFKQERAADLLQRKTQELADRAKAEKDLKKAAQEVGATYKTSDFVGANGSIAGVGPISGPASVVFTMDQGQISGPLTSNNTGFVLQVTDKQLPSAEEFAKQKDQLRNAMMAQRRNENFMMFAQATRTRMEKDGKIRWNKDEQKRLGLGAEAIPGLNR
ncbi:MAG: peptidyl-prolyl cis-trans isomerase, partial [Acidobacteriales bacterium]|nr:peptidyl-prolyl cis-trans isomerase [Terriglobales bacterium]